MPQRQPPRRFITEQGCEVVLEVEEPEPQLGIWLQDVDRSTSLLPPSGRVPTRRVCGLAVRYGTPGSIGSQASRRFSSTAARASRIITQATSTAQPCHGVRCAPGARTSPREGHRPRAAERAAGVGSAVDRGPAQGRPVQPHDQAHLQRRCLRARRCDWPSACSRMSA